MIQLNPTVGVAPGTTTMALSGLRDCPPDEMWRYSSPPDVQTGYPSGVKPNGAIPPPHYWDPYNDFPQLRGLGDDTSGDTSVRWGLVAFAGLATFATVFGVRYFMHRKKK